MNGMNQLILSGAPLCSYGIWTSVDELPIRHDTFPGPCEIARGQHIVFHPTDKVDNSMGFLLNSHVVLLNQRFLVR